MQRTLIIIGIVLLIAGILWPWLSRLGLFRLPGDIYVEKENVRFYFPVTSAIIISIVISVILWFFRK
ncbi:DUF2905 domain-containing protein [Thiohalophilus thiocyanatoxydans]|uniref:DUF2905 family protein n=1 Tax=Thiohalophilus thiocyanatoxydans TaxID=381308 RepID=A0A4R8ITA6_9GAMM|nr:DUF2905 domain-containing protein [Thiohalophilus thiocyanatoxydans]TDY04281.1 DUF2905 family protein [Thiohalophilus thiocyanatoxydans]